MFSSTNNTTSATVNPFPPYFPLSSNYHPPLPLPLPLPHLSHVLQADQINYGDIFLHHHHDPLSSQFSLNNALMAAPPPPETAINLGVSSSNGTPKQTMNALSCGDYHYGNINPYFLPKEVVLPVPAKKDRHSKIFTAQGLRDRRVRLSINVAREFFDLQDLLGFDKASKTLEWLLTKSRKAIRDLTRNNNKHVKGRSKSKNKTMSSTSECEDVSDVNEMENAASKDEDYKLKMKKLNEAAKESRAKARARARERTKEKLMGTVRSCPQILNQLRMFNEISEASSSSKVVIGDMSQVDHHSQDQSIVTKRKMKDPCSVSNYQQKLNGIVSESMESSNGHIQFGNAAQNWDINGAFTSCPSICAITNMNLSTGL